MLCASFGLSDIDEPQKQRRDCTFAYWVRLRSIDRTVLRKDEQRMPGYYTSVRCLCVDVRQQTDYLHYRLILDS